MTFPDRRHLQHMADVISVLVWRDQKSRYKSTGMGIFWAVASPVLFLLTFYLLFKVVLPLNIPNYASHLFIGLVVWTWFQGTTMESVSAIVGNASLVNQPRFPVAALPLASATSNLVTLCLTLPLLMVILWFEGAVLGRAILFLPILVLAQFIFVLSVAYLVAALNVRFRDLQYIVPIILQLGYFATPIFYDVSSVPPSALTYLQLNPMLTLIESYRDILMRNEIPNIRAVFLVFVASCLLLAASYRYFIRASAGFLEEV
jgi:lipopolysaccharide transport system permease protein